MQQLMVIPMLGLLSDSLQISPSATAWVLLAGLLTGAVSIGPLSRVADRYGPKIVYLVSMIGIMVGNGLCALAISEQSALLMILGRALIGMNIGTVLAVAVLKRLCSPRQMKQGMGIVTLGLGIGVAPAFLIAGVLLDRGVSLAGVFWVATALCIPIVVLVLLLPATPGEPGVRVPVWSAVLLGAWVLPACLALSFGNEWGWGSWRILGLAGVTVVAFAVWLRRERRIPNPLIAPRMLRGSALVGYYCTACVGLLAYGYYITASAFVQIPSTYGYGFDATIFQAGLVLLPVAVVVPALGPVSGRLMHVWGPKRVLLLGAILLTALFVTMTFAKSELWYMYAYAAWFGLGVTFFMLAGWALFATQARPSEIGIAGGMSQIFGTIFGSLASAVGVILTTWTFVPGTQVSVEGGYSAVFAFLAVALAIGAVLAARLPRDTSR